MTKKSYILSIIVAATLPAMASAAIYEVASDNGDYSLKVGGRVQLDYNRYDGVINQSEMNTDEEWFFRRARIELKGNIKDWDYAASYNVADVGSLDKAYVTYKGWGKQALLSIGQQSENFGLEDTTSSKWITAIERSMPANAFDTGNNRAVKLHGSNDTYTYSVVYVFDENISDGNDAIDHAVTGRFVFRPVYNEGQMIHLGAGFTKRDGEFEEFAARLGVRGGEDGLANKIRVRHHELVADEMTVWNIETAALFGSVHLMAEYFDGERSGAAGAPDIDADGYSVQVGWIITGEQRSYKTSSASFDKVKPAGDGGAWEVFARYDSLDVTDNDVSDPLVRDLSGGKGDTLTLGVNWYYGKHLKLGLNFISADVDDAIDGKDDGDAVAGRVQLVF